MWRPYPALCSGGVQGRLGEVAAGGNDTRAPELWERQFLEVPSFSGSGQEELKEPGSS